MATQTEAAWSTADSVLPYNIYLGVWTNWSRGTVLGQTLTCTRRNGDLIIAFTAFFIAFVGSRFWRISSIIMHRSYSTDQRSGTVHHQRQIILRNTDSADAGLIKFAQLLWAWRRDMAARSLIKVLPAFLMALLCVLAFTIAGGFSSQITTSAGTEVLIDGANCGFLYNNGTSLNAVLEGEASRRWSSALNYAQQCYNTDSESLFDCTGFVTERIPITIDNQVSCPFPQEVCRSNNSNLLLDTGFINTHDHLGINAPPDERLIFRSTLQCGPLVTAGFTTEYEGNTRNYTLYDYGPGGPSQAFNFTHKSRSLESQYSSERGEVIVADFLLFPYRFLSQNGSFEEASTDFIPREELLRTDADTLITFFTGNGVAFEMPTEDDWYRATHVYRTVYTPVAEGMNALQIYMPDEAASPMGCVQQYQFCLADEKTCGPPAGFYDAAAWIFEASGLSKDEAIAAAHDPLGNVDDPTIRRLQWLVGLITIPGDLRTVFLLGPQALASKTQMSGGLEGFLPVDQWKTDIIYGYATAFAFLQAYPVEIARGTTNPDLVEFRNGPVDATQVNICTNQKIRSTAYASFNYFALLFTYILGLVIIGLSFALEPLLDVLHRRMKYRSYANLEWTTNAILQTHRLAHEEIYDVDDIWSHCVDTIPTTASEFTMAPLDISDMKHPRLARSTEEVKLTSSSARVSLSADVPPPQTNHLEVPPSPPDSNTATRPSCATEVSSIADTVHSTEPSGSGGVNGLTDILSLTRSPSSADSERHLQDAPQELL